MNLSDNISGTISSIENELNLLSEEKRLNVQRSRAEELRDVLDLLKKAQESLVKVLYHIVSHCLTKSHQQLRNACPKSKTTIVL